jgi:hypothetical protein
LVIQRLKLLFGGGLVCALMALLGAPAGMLLGRGLDALGPWGGWLRLAALIIGGGLSLVWLLSLLINDHLLEYSLIGAALCIAGTSGLVLATSGGGLLMAILAGLIMPWAVIAGRILRAS